MRIKCLIRLSLLLTVTLAGTSDHKYEQGEHVELWVNKVRFFIVTI
jgi:hypothetical protein